MNEKLKFVLVRVKNIVGKGEIAFFFFFFLGGGAALDGKVVESQDCVVKG